MSTPEQHELTATQLLAGVNRASQMTAFVGLDGFVDDILHVVDKRESADKYLRLPTIAQLAERPRPLVCLDGHAVGPAEPERNDRSLRNHSTDDMSARRERRGRVGSSQLTLM